MRLRWTIAAAGALALGVLTLNLPAAWWSSGPPHAAADGVCDANAKPAPLDFTLKDMNNRSVKLADFKGKVLVVDFWATWCGPCKLEIPGFIEMQAKYGARGLQFVGIQVEDKPELLKPFVDEFKINYPVLQGSEREDVQDAFGPMYGIPVTVVIGRDGRICRKHTGMASREQFEREIKSLL